MKKIFALGMAAALSLSLLAGCGSNTASTPSAAPTGAGASPAPVIGGDRKRLEVRGGPEEQEDRRPGGHHR